MSTRQKMFAVALIVVVGLFMFSVQPVLAQGETGDCNGNFDCDEDVDGEDLSKFLSHFGRGTYDRPCPLCQDSLCPCTICPYGMVDCGDKCVDPQTEEDYCGVNSECVGGTVCAEGETCSGGTCTVSCQSGLTNCSGVCVDTNVDERYCGSCIDACEDGQICVAGMCEINYPVSVAKTGQTISDATGDDGDLQKGIEWPSPRFTDNSDGTVTDNLTGLIWLKNANCFGQNTWIPALSDCNTLAAGSCGLTDGSSAGDWRLPNISELLTLIDRSQFDPALPLDHPFTAVQLADYWTSTAVAFNNDAWSVELDTGIIFSANKTLNRYVWPVRDDNLPPPRFTDNGNGTVTDNHTELIWLKDAFCDDINDFGNGLNWDDAMAAAAGLNNGECGLTDGSSAGSWRLPTKEEWESFFCEYSPCICNTSGNGPWSEGDPFYSVQHTVPGERYWSSTESYEPAVEAAYLYFICNVDQLNKAAIGYVWPVR